MQGAFAPLLLSGKGNKVREAVTLRVLETSEEFAAIVALQQAIWGKPIQDTVSANVMRSVAHNGGAVIGAVSDGQLVGFTFCLVADRGDGITLWSHISGVHPEYQRQGIGVLLKREQRRWALERGHTMIAWTFDPLQRINARFNCTHLGVTASQYLVNFYGEMKDGINTGLATDRLEAVWKLHDPKVVALAEGIMPELSRETFPDDIFLVWRGHTSDHVPNLPLTQPLYYIEIPWDIVQLKQSDLQNAIVYQQAVRSAFLHAFAQGYIVCDFVQQDGRCWYVVRPRE